MMPLSKARMRERKRQDRVKPERLYPTDAEREAVRKLEQEHPEVTTFKDVKPRWQKGDPIPDYWPDKIPNCPDGRHR